MTFDMKVRFDTGRKLAMLVGSRPDFLRRGVTIACFCDAGSRPCISDVLTSVVRNGSSRSTDSRTRNVGTGSSMHDLTGDCIMMRCTSIWVQGLNDASDDNAVLDIGGGGSPAVADRTSRTFLSKNSAKLSAVWSVLPATSRSRPSSGDRERHSNDDERPHWLRRPTQYSSYLARFK